MRDRIRTPMRENRDVDLGPKPANLFAPLSGGASYVEIGGELVLGASGAYIPDGDYRGRKTELQRERRAAARSVAA